MPLFLLIPIFLAKSGHKKGAWISYVTCIVLTIFANIGLAKHYEYAYGRGRVGINTGALLFTFFIYIVAFFIIATSYDTVKKPRGLVVFGLVVAEEIFNTYPKKEDFTYMGVDNPYQLVNKLNEIAELLVGELANDKAETGMNLVEHYGYLYEKLKENGDDEAGAASALGITYNWVLNETYVNKLASYVSKNMKTDNNA